MAARISPFALLSGRSRCQRFFLRLDRIAETITETADRTNKERIRRVCLNLLSKAEDVDINRAVGNSAVVTPNSVKKLLAAEDNARTIHQKFEQTEFGSGKGQQRAIEPDFTAAAIQFEARSLQNASRSWSGREIGS